MSAKIPGVDEVREALGGLSHPQMRRLAELSAVSYFTLLKVRSGETPNPGIETVRKFLPHVSAARRAVAA